MHYFIYILNVVYFLREGSKAKTYFKRMHCDHFLPNTITSICIFKACSSTGALHRGKTQKVLKGLLVRVVASKNALISRYYQYRFGHTTLNLFEQMQNDGLSLDIITFVSLPKACDSVGVVDRNRKSQCNHE